MRATMHGNKVVRVHDDSAQEILWESYSPHSEKAQFRRPGQQPLIKNPILVATLDAVRFEIRKNYADFEIYDRRPDDGDANDLQVLREYAATHGARTADSDDRRTLADASLPHRQRLAALARINARARHDLR